MMTNKEMEENRGYVDKDNKLVIEDVAIWSQRETDKACDMSGIDDCIAIEIGTLINGTVGFIGNCSDSIELLIPDSLASIYTAKARLKITIEVIK